MRPSWRPLTCLAVLAALGGAVTRAPAGYLVTDLGPGFWANRVNDAGQVAGASGGQAALYSGGRLVSLGAPPGREYSLATAVNGSGLVVGSSSSGWSVGDRAFLYDGAYRELGALPGHNSSFAAGVNAAGLVAGTSSAAESP